MIEVKGYWIEDEGDMSVGIWPAQWKLEGTCCFDTPDDKRAFEQRLRWLFLDQGDGTPLRITTFEDKEKEYD
ncbi:MAG: hypothetical protein M0R06_01375 [Sphaerochaeta sp.]|nr:hypothetical protein [Sphaerochaeta sp.]